jgi:hypothetical protein
MQANQKVDIVAKNLYGWYQVRDGSWIDGQFLSASYNAPPMEVLVERGSVPTPTKSHREVSSSSSSSESSQSGVLKKESVPPIKEEGQEVPESDSPQASRGKKKAKVSIDASKAQPRPTREGKGAKAKRETKTGQRSSDAKKTKSKRSSKRRANPASNKSAQKKLPAEEEVSEVQGGKHSESSKSVEVLLDSAGSDSTGSSKSS